MRTHTRVARARARKLNLHLSNISSFAHGLLRRTMLAPSACY